MDKADVKDAFRKFDELINMELLVTTAEVHTLVRLGE